MISEGECPTSKIQTCRVLLTLHLVNANIGTYREKRDWHLPLLKQLLCTMNCNIWNASHAIWMCGFKAWLDECWQVSGNFLGWSFLPLGEGVVCYPKQSLKSRNYWQPANSPASIGFGSFPLWQHCCHAAGLVCSTVG